MADEGKRRKNISGIRRIHEAWRRNAEQRERPTKKKRRGTKKRRNKKEMRRGKKKQWIEDTLGETYE